ncbi:flagellar protein FlaG [Massilia forsythiae]|uniref:Flagellar protein FlaG n=1 Tax=Massilia forsythiae TaxID=2728020 RepID=A0A7Z2ZT37_9BURK|nr:flagellar protein FlaG [Massilia forsythiae]QJE00954.1 flagellar protein FlaG [Massilia forsythiae]
MNIQPLGASLAPKLEDRGTQAATASPAGPAAAAGKVSTTATAAAASAAISAAQPDRDTLDAAVKKINDSMAASSQSLEFSIDKDSKDIVVKVIDQNTREVLRQMPSAEALEIAKSIDKMQGLLIRQTA